MCGLCCAVVTAGLAARVRGGYSWYGLWGGRQQAMYCWPERMGPASTPLYAYGVMRRYPSSVSEIQSCSSATCGAMACMCLRVLHPSAPHSTGPELQPLHLAGTGPALLWYVASCYTLLIAQSVCVV